MKNKGIIRFVAGLCVTIFMLTLASCMTKLNGTYTNKGGLIEQSYTFSDENKVKVSAFGLNVEGTYVIEDDKIVITYGLLGLSYDMEQTFEKEKDAIIINGTRFVKEK